MSENTESTAASQSEDQSRILSIIAVSLTALMVVLIALVYYRLIAMGREAGEPSHPSKTATAQASETASASAEPDAQKPSMTLKEGREKLKLLTDNSMCQGETDADFLVEFARLSEEAGKWDADKAEVEARLKELPEKCGDMYVNSLANRLRSASTPSGLAELVEKTLSQAGADKRPAPQGAIDIPDFYDPSGNIQCAFSDTKLSCTISRYNYVSEECQGNPATYSISYDGTATQSCGTPVTSDSGVSYTTTVAHNGLACTVTQQGIECWHEASGEGFRLSPSAISKL